MARESAAEPWISELASAATQGQNTPFGRFADGVTPLSNLQGPPVVGNVYQEVAMRGGGSATYNMEEFKGELDEVLSNEDIGTTLWFENDHVRVWEVRLEPGQRAPFHNHHRTYFWTCIDPGRGFQRFPDGTAEAFDFKLGETVFSRIEPDDPMIHDLENADDHLVRFVAVELKDL